MIRSLIITLLIAIPELQATSLWMRLEGAADKLSFSKRGNMLALRDATTKTLNILHIPSKEVWQVTQTPVDDDFLWAPDGCRIFYKNQHSFKSELHVFDCYKKNSTRIETFAEKSSLMSFNNLLESLYIFAGGSIHRFKLSYPQEKHKVSTSEYHPPVLINYNKIYLIQNDLEPRLLSKDNSPIVALSQSHDNRFYLWQTKAQDIYYFDSKISSVKKIGVGLSPQWHPSKNIFVYQQAQLLGNTAIAHRFVINSAEGLTRSLEKNFIRNPRSYTWHPDGNAIVVSERGISDLFTIEIK